MYLNLFIDERAVTEEMTHSNNTRMTLNDIKKLTEENVLLTYGRRSLAFDTGEGVTLFDSEGNPYLDFAAGLGVNALGYAHPVVTDLIKRYAGNVLHTSNLYHISSQAILAKKLCNSSFGERVFFCNSGTEAIEGALKCARKWGNEFKPPKTNIVVFGNSFHGRTYGALSATMQEKYRKGFGPFLPGFTQAIFNDTVSVDNAFTNETVAVLVEPVQGEGGVNVAREDFLRHIESLCRERDALFIVDEVQCGMGRTGKLYAHEHFGVTPDIMTLAKPLAGGLPIGAVVTGPRVWPVIKPGDHASTFGGNHFVTRVACGVFDIISNSYFLDSIEKKGEYLMSLLMEVANKYSCIKEVRGKGLIVGVEVDFQASDAVDYFEAHYILICSAGPHVIRFIPPLIVTKDDIARVVSTLDRFLAGRS